ncbi:MAG TPA: type III pantothenate kinase [Paludibacteraceae bacterium]|nr:type III pantothenate kinase [Paludibacteraceae bacterium]
MNLVIDRGNSSTKIAVFDGCRLVHQAVIDLFEPSAFIRFITTYAVENIIYCSVVPTEQGLIDFFKNNNLRFVELTNRIAIPISLHYDTPETLGRDRIAALVGAWSLQPNKAALIIDMGSCITYDFITDEGVFEGGNIAPGFAMRLKAMHHFTGQLPYVEVEEPVAYLGKNTNQALLGGAYWGILHEIDGVISQLKLKYEEFSIFLTGGSAKHFEKQIKNCTFAEPNLVLIGLNEILIYNDIH